VRRFALPFVLLGLWAGAAAAEPVYRGTPVSDARLALAPNGEPVVAYVADGLLTLATRGAGGWSAQPLFILPSRNVELDGLVLAGDGRPVVLLRDRDGRWLATARRLTTGAWSWTLIRPDGKKDLIGPAGLTLDADQRPVIAYALWHPSHKTVLRVMRTDAAGVFRTRPVTRKGFPVTPTLAAAAPVLMPSGEIRVVETFAPAAIEWRPIPGDWVGQFLHSSALGIPTGAIAAAVSGSTVYATWTEMFPTLGPPAVVLAEHGTEVSSAIAVENAVLAGLALTPSGPEVAANRCVGNSCFGLVEGAGLDGIVAGFTVEPNGARELLLANDDGLDWYRSPSALPLHLTLNRDLSGRVDGAGGGAVTLYRERPDGTRSVVGLFPLAVDGSFKASDPTAGPVASGYRVVFTDRTTSIPYAAVVGP
jgi:hypothetical protein